ncbi:hypothetical protein FB00_11225 [Cellulosimicrobium funkei]|uniref:HK97 gp10 family phage protein n=1 Tax=Cellulosimicrobium funkei TaxID=264251 RepID=A0A0H2KM54_9MICO|nr:hypothetical protein [Cellulosimicrobium funkei]KLN34571.1 hypothetical protein FB00_11225 [Cellulosimicrobium funkei]
MSRVRVDGIREARAASYALRRVDADLRKDINAQARGVLNEIWQGEVAERSGHPMDARVLQKGARVATGARPYLAAATSSRALSGGLVPSESWRAFEFGANRHERVAYSRTSPKGKRHQVIRKTKRQLPQKTKGGRVLYPAVAATAPRIFALWSQNAIRLVFEALKKGA